MQISEIGGEFSLIKRLTGKKITDPNVICGVGDDCAVIGYISDKYLLLTTDMMVENRHFRLDWLSPFQIGKKLMEVNVSDIVSMGGTPKYALVSLSIKKNTTVEFLDEFYRGLYASAKRHNIIIIGGDTNRGRELVFNLTLVGEVKRSLLRLRSGAKIGDLICVTGDLGGSSAGLRILQSGVKDQKYLKKHLEPLARLAEESQLIAEYATAMIDISDGLSSEIKHICIESRVGAKIYCEKIPISKMTRLAAKITSCDPYDLALYGGEDFEILFTISKDKIENLQASFNGFSVIGETTNRQKGIYLLKDGQLRSLGEGYDHFI